jgi:predicted nucleic acid-binding protein
VKTAFLDANVIFSAAYAKESTLLRIWKLSGVRLCTSQYALDEVKRNLRGEAIERLAALTKKLLIVPETDIKIIPAGVSLREKDKPILAAAIAVRAGFLVTGDARDFGVYFGQSVGGVRIMRPCDFFAICAKRS